MGKQIESNNYWLNRYKTNISDIKYNTLGLIDVNIIPHYMRKDHLQWDKEFYERALADNPFTVYALTDSQALIYDNGNTYFVGGKPEIFGKIK